MEGQRQPRSPQALRTLTATRSALLAVLSSEDTGQGCPQPPGPCRAGSASVPAGRAWVPLLCRKQTAPGAPQKPDGQRQGGRAASRGGSHRQAGQAAELRDKGPQAVVCVGGFHAVCGANLLLAQTLRSRDPTWPVLGNYRPTFPGLARGRAQGSVSPSSKLGGAPEAPAGSGEVRPGPQLFLNTLSGHEGVRQTGMGLGVRGAKGPSGSGPGGSCREPLPASQSSGPGLGGGERGAGGYLVRGPGLPVPAFPWLRSTRPTMS